jgi:hypothetical protein
MTPRRRRRENRRSELVKATAKDIARAMKAENERNRRNKEAAVSRPREPLGELHPQTCLEDAGEVGLFARQGVSKKRNTTRGEDESSRETDLVTRRRRGPLTFSVLS